MLPTNLPSAGESANAIKIQIWVTLIANLLLMVIQRRIKRSWSFSGLATMFRIMLMYYVNCYTFFEQPENDWLRILEAAYPPPDEPNLFDWAYFSKKKTAIPIYRHCGQYFLFI